MDRMQNQSQSKQIAQKLGLIVSVGAAVKKWSSLTRKSKDRYYRLKELVETQQKYKIDLETIQQKIQKPLKQSNFISEYEQKEMFPNLDGMIILSKQIYEDMNALLVDWNRKTTLIAPTMIKYSKFMLVYSDFFKNYQNTEKKLKNLLQNHKEVQQIQKNISTGNFIQTFQSLMSKPFQRPLKYHLLLKEYFKQTPKNHPDYKNLEEAIQKYHQVNQRNNQAMQHKQKDKMLMNLDKIFVDIISSQARYFILDCEANVFNQKVKCYLLSDLLLISKQDGYKQIEYSRIVINQQSYAVAIRNGIHLKNGLLVCGKKNCIYLTFPEMSQRDKFLQILNRIIIDAYKNKHYKEEVRGSRRSTISSMSFRESSSILLEFRGSITKLENTLPQPPRIIVMGSIKRGYSSKQVKIYYLTKFQQPHPSDRNQMLYIDQDDMNMIERIAKTLYSKQKDFLQIACFSDLYKQMQSGSQTKVLEYRCIYYTLLLNSIFRNPQISKRTDIFMQKMDVSQGIWALLKYPGCECPCNNCSEGRIVNTIQKYNQQIKYRYQARQHPLTFYCPFRTFRTQDTISTMTEQQVKDLQSPYDRIFWIKTKRGDIQHRLLDSNNACVDHSKQVLFHLCGKEDRKYQRNVKRHDRVGQIKCNLGKEINIDLGEYQMCMQINKVTYLLGDDEILFKLLSNQVPNEQGFASFFKSAFGTKEDNRIKIYLKRIWWLSDIWLSFSQKLETRIDLFMQEMVFRLKNQEIQLSVNDTMVFYACYIIYSKNVKIQTEITLNMLEVLVPPKKWKLLTSKNKEQQLAVTRLKFKGLIQKYFSQLEGIAFKKKVFEYLIKFFKNKSVFGVYFYEATYAKEGKQVKIGFDFSSFIVKQSQKMVTVYESKITEVRDKLVFSGDELRILQQQSEYIFTNCSSFAQMVDLLDMFILYSKTFLQTSS